ncbi:MAG TPA: hypothetical protein DD381_02850 [Lentisphaeria bacterium]|nr:MAG: hypothetical protein A2X47_03405 [Lentisphaerae bacterium GWF2_38_69]HBM15273.1 hypothetical protein [Lentisphaeria bacterium]
MRSVAPDSIPSNTSYTAEKALLTGGNKYQPLQYLINSMFLRQYNERSQSLETVIKLRTEKIMTMNWGTASMQLMSALFLFIYRKSVMNKAESFQYGKLIALLGLQPTFLYCFSLFR